MKKPDKIQVQDDDPVIFTYKTVTPVEQQCENNERELLVSVFCTKSFQTYVFGKYFRIESDHKSLE